MKKRLKKATQTGELQKLYNPNVSRFDNAKFILEHFGIPFSHSRYNIISLHLKELYNLPHGKQRIKKFKTYCVSVRNERKRSQYIKRSKPNGSLAPKCPKKPAEILFQNVKVMWIKSIMKSDFKDGVVWRKVVV